MDTKALDTIQKGLKANALAQETLVQKAYTFRQLQEDLDNHLAYQQVLFHRISELPLSSQDRLDMEALEQSFRQVGSLYQDDYDAYQLSLSRDRERLLTEEATLIKERQLVMQGDRKEKGEADNGKNGTRSF
ncbi:hypothetical protein [Streptococcus thoraltensis]